MVTAAPGQALMARRSIEALRSGVPNRAAVQFLGTDQAAIESRFLDSLGQVAVGRESGKQMPGLIIQGEFGTGKSHLLEWLQHVALDAGFACSKVVISKETPLGDPHKLFQGAIENLTLPDRRGGLPEVVERLRIDGQAYTDLYRLLLDPQWHFDPIFRACLLLYERLHHDPELLDRIIAFWSGERIQIGEVKRHLRLIGQPRPDLRSRRISELALPRFRFASQLIGAAGYTGWVLLLDEVELVASLSLTGREKAYAVVAALAGRLAQQSVPGMLMVGAVTAEFTGVVFEQRRDRERIPQRWSERDPGKLAEMEGGMAFLASTGRQSMRIRRPESEALRRTHDRVRELYREAYDWTSPAIPPVEGGAPRSMRQHIRDWITRWDLTRLDPAYEPDIETREVAPDLTELPDLETSEEPETDDR